MSICPEIDIHSVYLDGELPAAYVKDYEAHLESCPECRKHLKSLKLLRAVFNADKKSMEMSQKDLDDSFERLQARLSFSRHTKSNVVEFKPRIPNINPDGGIQARGERGHSFSNGNPCLSG